MTATSSPPTPVQRPAALSTRLTGRNGSRLFVTLLATWIIFVTFAAQCTAWVQASLDTMQLGDWGPWWRASLVQALLIGLPALAFALRWRVLRYRAIFQCWAWAVGYGLLLMPTRIWPPVESQTIVLVQVALTVGYWLFMRFRQVEKLPIPPAGIALALLVGAVAALPWLRVGALGSLLDVVLNGALAVAFGLLAWTILQVSWIPAQRRDPRRPRRDRLTAGLVAGVMLLLMASALSLNGVQVFLMIVLPALAWAVLATGAPALALALVAAAPLLLIDTDAVVLLAQDDLLLYYFAAAFITLLIGWLIALLILLPQPDPGKFLSRAVAWSGAGVALLLAAVVYLTAGQQGFYGDSVFVVLNDQADLSEAAALPDLAARREAVYRALVDHADASQADLRGALDRLGIGYTPYYLVNGLEINGGLLLRLWLERRPDVAQLMVSPHLRPAAPLQLASDEPYKAPTEPQWNLTNIGAERVWRELGVTGEGVVVGLSDSGVQGDHPEFAERYRGRSGGDDYNWFDPWNHSPSPNDQDGHGTHTLGSVLGKSVGVAPGATWFACANLVRNLGNPALYLDCMQFMLAPFPSAGDPWRDGDPSLAADVLNNSWGCPTDVEGCAPEVFDSAIKALTAAGIFVVVSAGNEGPECGTIAAPPAIYEQSLTVGAVDATNNVADFSSAGPVLVDGSGRIKPELLAPGVDVLSAWPGDSYNVVSGTSMAGPHVVGVVALLWSANPLLRGDIERTRKILEETAHPFEGDLEGSAPLAENSVSDQITGAGEPLAQMLGLATDSSCLAHTDLSVIPNNVAGYGIVDAYAAVQAALAAQ